MHISFVNEPRRPGDYPWDHWEREVVARGLDEELACLGRAVYREAYQHGWGHPATRLASEEILEALLFRAPELAGRLYDILLETDGLRFAQVEGERNAAPIELADLNL